MKKKINKIIVFSGVVFVFFFVRAIQNVRSAPKFVPDARKESSPASSKSVSALPPFQDFSVFEKVKNGNYFLSALEAKTAVGGAGGTGGAELPPPAENEVREKDTGITYRFLGTMSQGGLLSACFMRSDPQKKAEEKCLSVHKGEKLGGRMNVRDVGGDWVKIQNGEEDLELKVFSLEIRTLASAGAPDAGAQTAPTRAGQNLNPGERLKKRMEQRGNRMSGMSLNQQKEALGLGERFGSLRPEGSEQLNSQGQTEGQGRPAGASASRGTRRLENPNKRGAPRRK